MFIVDLRHTNPIKFRAFGREIGETWKDVFTTAVVVTTERPCYDRFRGLKINNKQPIASFFSKAFPNPIEARLDMDSTSDDSRLFSNMSSANMAIGKGQEKDLRISFMRTVRVPEDQTTYD